MHFNQGTDLIKFQTTVEQHEFTCQKQKKQKKLLKLFLALCYWFSVMAGGGLLKTVE